MAGGTPLDDKDREPWLHRIRETAIDLTHPARESVAVQEGGGQTQRQLAEVYETSGHSVDAGMVQAIEEDGEARKEQGNAVVGGAPPQPHEQADDTPRRRAGCIIACSALKKAYRDLLRGDIVTLAGKPRSDEETGKEQSLQTVHVYLDVPPEELLRRMEARSATHFMPPQLLKTQLAALEAPDSASERDVIVVKQDGQGDLQQMVQDTAKILEGYLKAP